jgi:Adenylate and Guanylate cyclase catalytic domain
VVGSIGNDLRMDYTAVGDTTNVAARLQAAADPGRIVISEATHRLVSGYFYSRSLGEIPLYSDATKDSGFLKPHNWRTCSFTPARYRKKWRIASICSRRVANQ